MPPEDMVINSCQVMQAANSPATCLYDLGFGRAIQYVNDEVVSDDGELIKAAQNAYNGHCQEDTSINWLTSQSCLNK